MDTEYDRIEREITIEATPEVPIVDTQVYRVATLNFLADGGDNFATFAQGTGVADSGQVDLQAASVRVVVRELVGDGVQEPKAIGAEQTAPRRGRDPSREIDRRLARPELVINRLGQRRHVVRGARLEFVGDALM